MFPFWMYGSRYIDDLSQREELVARGRRKKIVRSTHRRPGAAGAPPAPPAFGYKFPDIRPFVSFEMGQFSRDLMVIAFLGGHIAFHPVQCVRPIYQSAPLSPASPLLPPSRSTAGRDKGWRRSRGDDRGCTAWKKGVGSGLCDGSRVSSALVTILRERAKRRPKGAVSGSKADRGARAVIPEMPPKRARWVPEEGEIGGRVD